MSQSPAQRHFRRVTAERTAASAAPGDTLRGANAYELMLAQLATDRRRLKDIQSVERKIDVKRELLPAYADYIAGALEGGRGAQDDVLMTVLIWRIDTADYDGALTLADYALQHRLSLPDAYARNTATMLIDEIANAALAGRMPASDHTLHVLNEVARLTDSHDAPDQARAKLHKAIGMAQLERADQASEPEGAGDNATNLAALTDANTHLRRALELFDSVGVKKDIERLERRLKKLADSRVAIG